jgi:hypothetical protein
VLHCSFGPCSECGSQSLSLPFPPSPTCALGPAANGWAAISACDRLPLGPKLAQLPPVAFGRRSRWTAERASRSVKMSQPDSPCLANPRPFSLSPLVYCSHNVSGPAGLSATGPRPPVISPSPLFPFPPPLLQHLNNARSREWDGGWLWPVPPLAPSPTHAFTRGWARLRRVAQWWCMRPCPSRRRCGGGPASKRLTLSVRLARVEATPTTVVVAR